MPDEKQADWTTDPLYHHLVAMAQERLRLLEEKTLRLEQKIDYERQIVDERDKRYEQRFMERDTRYEQKFQAQEAATIYMRQVTNEFRGQLSDQQSTFITRTEALARAQSNAEKIESLATRIDRNEGRSGGLHAGWGFLVGAVGLVAALIAIFLALKG